MNVLPRASRDVADLPHDVYVHLDAQGFVIYVGCTMNLPDRTGKHRRNSPWGRRIASVEVEGTYPNRSKALVREYELIRFYQPSQNRYGVDHDVPAVPQRWLVAAARSARGPVDGSVAS